MGGCANSKTYWSEEKTVTLAAGRSLINRSEASTPVTGSLKCTSTAVRSRTAAPAGGIKLATVGRTVSTAVESETLMTKSLLLVMSALKAWMASTLLPGTSNVEGLLIAYVSNGIGSAKAGNDVPLYGTAPAGML